MKLALKFKSVLVPAGLFLLTISGNAQWVVVDLHPGTAYSSALGVAGGQQVGRTFPGGADHASLWSGTAGSWVDLNPTGAANSIANGVGGGQQAGYAVVGSSYRASLWSGTASSWVDLSPAGASDSAAYGVDAGKQVGNAYFGGIGHAGMWSGTSASWVDLKPANATDSAAYGVGAGQQVGYVLVDTAYHASLWTGTVGSWVDLNPSGATFSEAYGASGGQQVGIARIGGVYHASLWSGTAGSWIDLSPAGAVDSEAYGVNGGQQVGYATVGGRDRASLWNGTSASWVDLHVSLPTNFTSSFARGISHNVGVTYVVGYGYNATFSRREALMWILPANVRPSSFSVFRGVLEAGDLSSLLNSDDNYLVVRNGVTALRTESPIMLRVSGHSPIQSPITLQFVVENKVSITGLNQLIDLFDYTQGRFVNADTRAASTTDSVVTVSGSRANVESGTGNLQSQLQIRPAGPVFTNTWRSFVDQVNWLVG